MGPWSFPIVAEARMAERLLEAERARLARAAATGQGSRGSARAGAPQPARATGRVSRRRRLATIGVTLVACLVLAGPVMTGDEAAVASVVPVRPTFRIVMTPALVSGEWVCLSNGYCEVRLNGPRVSDRGPAFDPAASSLGDGPLTGTFSLHGPDGAWAGPVAATWDDRVVGSEVFSGAGQVFGREGGFALQGTEAYVGWAFVGAWLDPMNGEPAQVGEIIYRGLAPDLDELRAPRAAPVDAVVAASDGSADPASPPHQPRLALHRAAEPEAVPASVCGVPYIGWPVGPTALIADLSILAAPYLALTTCPWP